MEQSINNSSDKRTYTVREIAEMLRISERAAYYLCKNTTDFKVLSLGRSVRINRKSFDEWFS